MTDDAFKRVLGLPQVTMSGVAVIIGAGIFVLLGPATREAGGAVWLSFVFAGALSALTAFSYMELASMFPKAGSEHEFASQVFSRWVAVVVGWSMTAALVVAAATVSLGFGRYLNEFVSVDERLAAAVLLLIMAVVSYLGMERAAWLVILLALVEIGSLIAVIVIGVPSVGNHDLLSGSFTGVLSAAGLVFFAFIGFDEVITLAEETRDPTWTVPRALLLALGISTLLYVGVAVSAVSVLGADALAVADRPLAAVGEKVFGGWAGSALSSAAMVSTGTTVLLVLTAGSRMFYGMAGANDLPRFLAEVRFQRVPLNALIVTVIAALGLLLLGDLKTLASATDALIYLTFLVVNAAVVALRRTQPELHRPFRIRGAIGWVPVLPVLAFIAVVVVARELQQSSFWMVGVIVALGLAVHALHRVTSRREA
ncbi:MAG: APC family permease [Ilumatobacteraceae bacterium]|jgi:APA family basic amino acid/polyamine antiporter|nr:amino acid permease [Actinomycetota bacterium]NCZ86432.1 amino acid permease [Actinomycetota bacterium]NDF81772.1 amino acid permease [Actinomycetota bacterium]NDH37049.1 amino acid permease [Acidimicrobiia bacterium]